jgi:hypothetical protein
MRPARSPQRGIGTLALSMLLLVGASIVLFYLNRSLIFEQRSSANQLRSTTALEVAEAGLQWATGMLNRPEAMLGDCTPGPGGTASFRSKYVPQVGAALAPIDKVFPGCSISGASLTCSCPDVPASGTAAAALGPGTWPGFTVSFAAVPGEPESVRIASVGCSSVAGACTSLAAAATDATLTVTEILKLSPLFHAAPAAALTCGGTCTIDTVSVENLDVATNGITVDAAGPVAFGVDRVTSIAGLPPENSVLADDPALATLAAADPVCTAGVLFRTYFGSSVAAYADTPTTKAVHCPVAGACPELAAAYALGWRSFYLPDGALLGAGTLGSATEPVTLVSPGTITLSGNAAVHGLVFANAATLGAGTPAVRGALLACAAFTGAGNGTVAYDAAALLAVQRSSALMVRVPGSWRDFQLTP